MSLAALIFDCDGTLADTMPSHYRAWTGLLERHGLEMTEQRFHELGGWPTLAVAELLIREAGRNDLDPHELTREKERRFEEVLPLIRPIEPVVQIARTWFGRLPLAVATGATRSICERILRQLGLLGLFDVLVSSEDVRRHKPAPDPFLEAARRLGVEPHRCRVYEDADPGIEAAHRAGMEVVDVRSLYEQPRFPHER